jgi:arylsulfatase A-like enzyme
MVIRYPREIPAGSASHSLVQAVDLVPTFFDLAGAKVPANYDANGVSIRSLFKQPGALIHTNLFAELGSARAVINADYKYIANRYPTWQIEKIKGRGANSDAKQFTLLSYLASHLGISVRGMNYNSSYFDADQLYDRKSDPGELKNLAGKPEHRIALEQMKRELMAYLEIEKRPYGEMIPGKMAVPPGAVQPEIDRAKTVLQSGPVTRRTLSDTPETLLP